MSQIGKVFIVPYLNGQLLGDKILLSAIVSDLALHYPGAHILGIEPAGSLSMSCYVVPPNSIRVGDVNSLVDEALKELTSNDAERNALLLYCDHSSTLHAYWTCDSRAIVIDLWDALLRCAGRGIFPSINVKQQWRDAAMSTLLAEGIALGEPYVVMHTRKLDRQQWKNSDIGFCATFVERLIEASKVPVIAIGDDDDTITWSGRMIDFRRQNLTITQTAGILMGASLFVGGDSGPVHLAGAVGCPILGIGYVTDRYGPFVPSHQLVGRFGPVGLENVENCKKADDIIEKATKFLSGNSRVDNKAVLSCRQNPDIFAERELVYEL